ncbi:MAG: molybdenum cofactor biosynthesis protein MoaE [Candidatus Dormibacteraeota bacterium]|nr:molybdenum cofactor biosynthesis protein MoaE [Candidatus Dormibacteraeota bacterium]
MVTALLFARLREQAGTDREQLDLGGESVARVYGALRERHPQLEADVSRIRPARNEELAAWDDRVADGDVIAFLLPVSGGAEVEGLVELTAEALDARRLEAAVIHPGAGGVCTFTGMVRDSARGQAVTRLEYEAYAAMAERQMRLIVAEIAERWPEAHVAMAHRTGVLAIGEPSVVVSVSCPHRAEAFAACRWGIDRLKESVPIWKKEFAASGAVWIEGAGSQPAPSG